MIRLPLYRNTFAEALGSGVVGTPQKRAQKNRFSKGQVFSLTVRSFYLRLVLVAYGKLALSFYLWLKFGLVFLAYGGKAVWSFLLSVAPVQKLDLVYFTYSSPTESKKDEP